MLDPVTSTKQLAQTSFSLKQAQKEYAKGLKNFGARYNLDPASLFCTESTPVSGSGDGKNVPVVTSQGETVGHAQVPQD